jgi:hypothetical protein
MPSSIYIAPLAPNKYPATAGLAKSALEAANIRCELADENAYLYSYEASIRLLVAEDQVQEALKVLDLDAHEPLPGSANGASANKAR